uniref:trypsin n=1 Tax=Sinocyclocheilus anshuiensis TaxID=1608454 RepID=A0A671RSB5_9TELE
MNLKLCLLLLFLCAVIIPAQVCMNSYMLIYHMLFLKYIVVHNIFFIWMKIKQINLSPFGYSGKCSPNPCLNGGECEEKRDKFKCKCPKQFVGRRCERGKRVCKRGTCGAGLCLLTPSPPYYKCKCIPPFAPPNCRSTAPCNPSPCQNNGRCVVDEGDFDCICPDGYSGQYCQVGPDDCYEGDGQSYRGKVSETEDGDECLYWNSEFVLDKGAFPSVAFASSEGLGPHNFCRNPDGDKKPWCFIKKDRRLRWDYCDVRKCPTRGKTYDKDTVITPESTSSVHITTTPVPPTTLPKNYTLTRDFLTCGKPEPKKQVNRIYGGLKAIPGAHPWQVSVQVKPKGSIQEYRHICGGTLIKPCWVLTAAHCIDKKHDYRVILGGLNLIQKEQTDQTVLVEDTIIHEKFKETPDVVYNDIALLKLKATNGECAKETQFVKAACLPKAPFADGTECRISGWGATETSEYGSVHLLDAQVLLISQEACSSNKVYASLLDDGMFCAGYLKGGVDSCQGDSGGPLTCERNETHYIYGIVSWGDNCGEKNKPGVYTRVLKYLDWINEKISVPQ